MKTIKKTTKLFDQYGKGILLNINGKETIKSFMGGAFSIFYNIFFLIILILNFNDFLQRDPKILQSSSFRPAESALDNITQPEILISTFFMAFNSSPPLPLPYYPLNSSSNAFSLEYVNNEEKLSRFNLGNFIKCEMSDIYMKDEYYQNPYSIAKMKSKGGNFSSCFEINKTRGYFELGGDTETRNKTFINILNVHYDLCEIIGKPQGCNLTESEFKSLSHINFVFMLKNNYANYKSDIGISSFFEGKNIEINYEMDYTLTITAKRFIISTDRNLIYNFLDSEVNQNYMFSVEVASEEKKRNKNEFVVRFQFNLSNYVDLIERSYLKLDEMLANTGSIVVIIQILSMALAAFFSEGNMEHTIYKEIFHIKKLGRSSSEFLNVNFNNFTIKKKPIYAFRNNSPFNNIKYDIGNFKNFLKNFNVASIENDKNDQTKEFSFTNYIKKENINNDFQIKMSIIRKINIVFNLI